MKKLVFAFAFVMSIPNSFADQSTVGFFDGSSTLVGTLVEVERGQPSIFILTTDGYLLDYGPHDGGIRSRSIYFESNDCSGQPYIYSTEMSGYEIHRGGEIFHIFGTDDAGRVAWVPNTTDITPQSRMSDQGCVPASSEGCPCNGAMVEIVNKSNYGLTVLPNGNLGYNPKLTAEVSTGDELFCTGFESCQVP